MLILLYKLYSFIYLSKVDKSLKVVQKIKTENRKMTLNIIKKYESEQPH